ncbi:hypothetical protein M433DRAFT_339467 [Acidomyces richmondensis BFW]|nr:MAG: hypothetical protein FE78DRAFT_174110 [Acidomyces sp. 'richmondensis']KYG49206.1 hypothetical protein M433DRAFT_339467 [Acidomyces richmondensis BFW]
MSTAAPLALGPYATPLLAPAWAEFGLALIVVIARVYSSCVITRLVRLDLYLSIVTFLLASLSLAFFTVAVCYGLGKHAALLSPTQETVAMKWAWANTIVSLFAISTGKFTVVAFLQQLHTPHQRPQVIFLWLLASTNLIVNTMTVGTILGMCTPAAKLWNRTLPGTCDGIIRNQNCAYFQGSWSAMVDLVLALYPAFFFWNVNLKIMHKLGLSILMGLGVVACACSAVKTYKLSALSNTSDVTYYVGQLDIWNTTEMWIVLIVACIPPIRALLRQILHKAVSTVYSGQGTRDKSGTELRNYYHSKSSNAGFRRSTKECDPMDHDSMEDILGGHDQVITRTTNIDVTEQNVCSETNDQYFVFK